MALALMIEIIIVGHFVLDTNCSLMFPQWGEGYSVNVWVWVFRRDSETLTPFQTKVTCIL